MKIGAHPVPFSFPNRLARPLCRAVSLLAYGLTGPLHAYASRVMLAAYNDVCPPGNRFLEMESADNAAISTLIILAVVLPVLLSHSNVVIGVNLVSSLLTLLLAARLPFIAQTPPYQCVTMGGSYEEHVSGLPEFELYLLLILFLSYILLLIDWGVWTARLLPRAFRRPANASAPPGADESHRRRAAIGSWVAMVGALILARMSDDAALSDEILSETGAWLAGQGQI